MPKILNKQNSLRLHFMLQWVISGFFGIILAVMFYYALPDMIRNPIDDEDVWLTQPWRLSILNVVFYTPISASQWFILRKYVNGAWLWLILTVGCTSILYPVSIWAFWSLHLWDIAWGIWFLGLGGSSIYILTQWIVLFRWRLSLLFWFIGVITLIAGGLLILNLISGLTLDQPIKNGSVSEQLLTIIAWLLYQCVVGGVLTMLFKLNLENRHQN